MSPTGITAMAWVTDAVGAAVARRHRLVGEPAMIRPPFELEGPLELTVWGTATSAPFLMDAALLVAPPTGRRVLGALRIAGTLAEPVTWGRRRPRAAMLLSAAHLALGVALLRSRG